MSDIVKTQSGKPAKRRRTAESVVEVPAIEPTESSLADVAILAADAELATAIQTFDARYAENVQVFGAHVRRVQQRTANALRQKISDAYGVSEDAIYEQND